jgi:hypothetical protein
MSPFFPSMTGKNLHVLGFPLTAATILASGAARIHSSCDEAVEYDEDGQPAVDVALA